VFKAKGFIKTKGRVLIGYKILYRVKDSIARGMGGWVDGWMGGWVRTCIYLSDNGDPIYGINRR
jgi:hypothetical protein